MTIYRLDVLLSYLESVCCSMSSSNCCFLTCIPISQEAGQVVWYSHLFQNLPQFIVIHTVKGFGIVIKAEIDVFWNSLAFSMIQRMLAIWSLVPLPFLKLILLGSYNRKQESKMVLAKGQGREKPLKIEQRKFRGPEWGPQVEQTALLASPVYIGPTQGWRKKHIKREIKGPGLSVLFASLGRQALIARGYIFLLFSK